LRSAKKIAAIPSTQSPLFEPEVVARPHVREVDRQEEVARLSDVVVRGEASHAPEEESERESRT
jgi:hypothetical protein